MSALFTDTGRYRSRIHRVVRESPSVVTLHFEQPSGFHYEAGQYITVFFDETGIKEGKAYSLSSYPDDIDLCITIKKVGLFSGKLHELKPGDHVNISRAYGMFNAFGDMSLVALAAGVGIAPIYSIIRSEALRGTRRHIQLIYTNTHDNEILFQDDLNRLRQYMPELDVRYVVTRQQNSMYYGTRMKGADIATEFPGRAVCICGTVGFVRDLRRQLAAAGTPEDHIMTEVFLEQGGE